MRRLSARVSSSYVHALLQAADKGTGREPVDGIIVEQTRYFDLSNDQDIGGLLTTLLEDDDKMAEQDDTELKADADADADAEPGSDSV